MFPDWGLILVFGAWPPECYTKRSHLGRWPGCAGHVWRGFDRRVLHCPQMLFHRLGDTKSAFSLSLWISVTFTDDISLLSGALNSVNWEGPKCLFRVTRYGSHRGDTTPSGSSSLQSHPDTWRSYLYPTESGAVAHTAEIYAVWRGGPPEVGNGVTRHAASDA